MRNLLPVGVAVVILATGLLLYPGRPSTAEPVPVPTVTPVAVAAGGAELIVQEGDLVEASGLVEDGLLCSPAPSLSAPCMFGIAVPGIDSTEWVTVRGRWHPGRLSDIERLPYRPTTAGEAGPGPDLPDTPPCPAPAGGWRPGEDWDDELVKNYLEENADRFAQPFATHDGNARILVVEVVRGDVDEARATLTGIYQDNMCVVAAPGKRSLADDIRLDATVGAAVGVLMDAGGSGIYLAGPENGKYRVNMVQLTQPLYEKLTAIGLDQLILDPWIRPAG